MIGVGHNGIVLKGWGNTEVTESLQQWPHSVAYTDTLHGNGRWIGKYSYPKKTGESHMIPRGRLAEILYNYARSLGIEMRLGVKVSEYWEDGDEAGIVVNGERIAADCVVCADGAHSRARHFVSVLFILRGIPCSVER